MSYSHSRKPDLPVTHSSPFSTSSFFPPPLKPRCQGRAMGFVGGGGIITIATALPPSSFVYCCKHQIVYGFSLSHFLWLPEASVSECGDKPLLWRQTQDVETNCRPATAVCIIRCSNVRGLAGDLSDLTVALSQYDILLCSETLVPDMRHVSEVSDMRYVSQVLVLGFCRPVLL